VRDRTLKKRKKEREKGGKGVGETNIEGRGPEGGNNKDSVEHDAACPLEV